MPAAAHDAPRPGALSTTVTPRPAWAARQAMPRPITPPPTTTTSLVAASAALVLIRATLPSPALPGAGSDGRRRTAALSARWHPGSRVPSAYARPLARGQRSAPRVLLPLLLFHDQGLGREQQRGDRSGVLHRGARDLGRVDDPRLEQVDVLAGGRVEAVVLGDLADLVDRDGP